MASIFSHLFVASETGAGGTYTVPTGYTAVLRNITLVNESGSTGGGYLVVISPSGTRVAQGTLSAQAAGTTSSDRYIETRIVLQAGESVSWSNAALVDMTISGYLFAS